MLYELVMVNYVAFRRSTFLKNGDNKHIYFLGRNDVMMSDKNCIDYRGRAFVYLKPTCKHIKTTQLNSTQVDKVYKEASSVLKDGKNVPIKREEVGKVVEINMDVLKMGCLWVL